MPADCSKGGVQRRRRRGLQPLIIATCAYTCIYMHKLSYQCWVVEAGVDLGVIKRILHRRASPTSRGMLYNTAGGAASTCGRGRAVLDQ